MVPSTTANHQVSPLMDRSGETLEEFAHRELIVIFPA